MPTVINPIPDDIGIYLQYDENSPSFITWKARFGNTHMHVGDHAGNINHNGYWDVYFKGRTHVVSGVIWKLFNGDIPQDLEIDHIDGVRTNNNINNLRLATRVQQARNVKCYSNNKSGHKNIHRYEYKSMGKVVWNVQFKIDGKYKTKSFKYTEEGLAEAIIYRDSIIKEVFGKFARLK